MEFAPARSEAVLLNKLPGKADQAGGQGLPIGLRIGQNDRQRLSGAGNVGEYGGFGGQFFSCRQFRKHLPVEQGERGLVARGRAGKRATLAIFVFATIGVGYGLAEKKSRTLARAKIREDSFSFMGADSSAIQPCIREAMRP